MNARFSCTATVIVLTLGCASTLPTWKANTAQLEVDSFIIQGENVSPVGVQGTGVFLGPEGTMVTNNHVMRRCRKVIARFEDGRSSAVDQIVAISPDYDVAVMRAKGVSNLQKVRLAKREEVEKGEEILAVGNVFGMGLSVMRGYIENIVPVDDKEYIIISADVAGGASGGPVFDKEGRLVGIIQGFVPAPNKKLPLVIPAWRIASVLEGRNVCEVRCSKCDDCYSRESLKRAAKPIAHRRVALESGEKAQFDLQLEGGRDYVIIVEVHQGGVQMVGGDGQRARFRAGQGGLAIFTAPASGTANIAFVNTRDETAVFEVALGRVEW